ncbi:MAG TPA: glycosyltransferase family 39 protein [Gemmatimonadaceae bacterium]|nr:glycosyltransferase family 39 protein [Gemmatimonadaceae bacterium]
MSRAPLRARVLLAIGLGWALLVLVVYFAPTARELARTGWPELAIHGDWRHPDLIGAAARAATALVGAGWLVLTAVLLGATIARLARWHFDDPVFALPATFAIGAATLAYIGLALAAVGAYHAWSLRIVTIVTTVASLIVLRRGAPRRIYIARQERHDTGRSEHAAVRTERGIARAAQTAGWRRLLPHGSDRVWGALLVIALAVTLVAALAPEREYDAVWFHLWFPQLALQHGTLVDVPSEYVSLYPMTWELWFGYGLALGGPVAAKLLHFVCLPALAMLGAAAARRWGRASPMLTAALVATVPLAMWDASTAYVDLATTLYVALVVLALVRYVEERRAQWLAIAAIALGVALATKHLALFVALLACGGLAVTLWWRERNVVRALRPALLLGVIALLIPLPWYLRAWHATGNPVFPELYHLFGAPSARWDAQSDAGLHSFMEHFGRSRTLAHLLTLPWDATMHAARYDGTTGPLFLAILPAFALARPRRGAVIAIGLFTLAFVLLWASPVASFQLRWLLPLLPFVAWLAAIAARHLVALTRRAAGRRAARIVVGALALLLVLDLPFFTPLHERDRHGWSGWLNGTLHGVPVAVVAGAESRDTFLARQIRTYTAWKWIDRSLPADARLLTWSGGDHLYSHRARINVFAPLARAAAWARPADRASAFDSLGALGVDYLLLDRRFLHDNGLPDFTWEDFALTDSATRATRYELVYENDHALVYRVRWESFAATRVAADSQGASGATHRPPARPADTTSSRTARSPEAKRAAHASGSQERPAGSP